MPKPYPRELRENVVAVARQGNEGLEQIAMDFGIAESCLRNWLAAATPTTASGATRRPGG